MIREAHLTQTEELHKPPVKDGPGLALNRYQVHPRQTGAYRSPLAGFPPTIHLARVVSLVRAAPMAAPLARKPQSKAAILQDIQKTFGNRYAQKVVADYRKTSGATDKDIPASIPKESPAEQARERAEEAKGKEERRAKEKQAAKEGKPKEPPVEEMALKLAQAQAKEQAKGETEGSKATPKAPVLRTAPPSSSGKAKSVKASGSPPSAGAGFKVLPRNAQAHGLHVSSPSDPAEREADATAKQVMRMPAPSGESSPSGAPRAGSGKGGLQLSRLESPAPAIGQGGSTLLARKADGGGKAPDDVADEIQKNLGGGMPMPSGLRAFMEPRFGADFGDVRIHTGKVPARLALQVQARAFAFGRHIFFGPGQYQPSSAEGRELIAHELTHTIQQKAVVQRRASVKVGEQAPTGIHRGSLILDKLADKANMLPGYRMLTIVLGKNPINGSPVEASAGNILRALIEFMPGGGLITQALDNHGVFDKVSEMVSQQAKALGLTPEAIKQSLTKFIDSLSASDILSPGKVWERAKSLFTGPIDKLISLAKSLVAAIIQFVKDAILKPIGKLAEGTPSYDLLKAVMGKDPVTGEPVADDGDAVIGGFMKLIGQQETFDNMKKANAGARVWAWFKGALGGLKSFVLEIPPTFIAAFKSLELADIILVPRAFAKLASVFGNFLGRFISWAGEAVWNLAEIIFEVVSPGALGYVKKTGAALKAILMNPLPFVGNLINAAKLGFTNFAGNFLGHLKAGLLDWLTGSMPGVYVPKAFSLGELVKFVLSVLGLTWANVRAKLVAAVGETAVKAMETGFDIVKTLVTQGPAAAWEQMKAELANLKDMVISGITSMVVETIVQKAVPKLIAMFIPGAGFISAILSIYDTVMVFVQKISKIIQVVTAFIDSIVTIAAGNIAAAAGRVESILSGLLSLAISFLAGFLGLGKVADKIKGVIEKIKAPIDKGLDAIIKWVVKSAKAMFAKVTGKEKAKVDTRTPAQKQKDLAMAVQAAEAKLFAPDADAAKVKPALPAIGNKFGAVSIQYVETKDDASIMVELGARKSTKKKSAPGKGGDDDRSKAVKQKVKAAAAGKSIKDPDQAKSLIGSLFSGYSRQGLKGIKVVFDPAKPKTAGIKVSASAAEIVATLNVDSVANVVKLSKFVRKYDYLAGGTLLHVFYDTDRKAYSGSPITNAKKNFHAEEVFKNKHLGKLIAEVQAHKAKGTLLTPPGSKVQVELNLNRITCTKCAGILASLADAHPDLQFVVRASSRSNAEATFEVHADYIAGMIEKGVIVEPLGIWPEIQKKFLELHGKMRAGEICLVDGSGEFDEIKAAAGLIMRNLSQEQNVRELIERAKQILADKKKRSEDAKGLAAIPPMGTGVT